MKQQCESFTAKGKTCNLNAKNGHIFCYRHVNNPLTTSRKFLSRHTTLVHDLAEDVANRLPRTHGCQNNVCTYCKVILTKDNKSVDHVIRLVKNCRINPLTNLSNVTFPCCKTCNSQQQGQKIQIFTESDVTVRYKLDCEDELHEGLELIKRIMTRMDRLVQNAKLIESKD
jgi:hypothetical protein